MRREIKRRALNVIIVIAVIVIAYLWLRLALEVNLGD